MEFNFKRFWLLIVSQCTEQKGTILLTLLLYFLLPVVFTPFDYLSEAILLLIALYPLAWTATYSFKNYNRPAKRSNAILLPASREEKYLSTFLINVIVMPVLIIFVALLGEYIGELIFPTTVLGKPTVMLTSAIGKRMTTFELLSILAGLSICFYTSLFFRKHQFISTFAICMLALLCYLGMWRPIANQYLQVDCGELIFDTRVEFVTVFFAVCIPFFLILTYFRLKEERV